MEKKTLGDAELLIMQKIWAANEPVSSSYILTKIEDKRPWKQSTLMTALSRLAEKGFLRCEKTPAGNRYSALISEGVYKTEISKSFMEKIFGESSVGALVAGLHGSNALSEKDITDLRRFLDELQEEGK